MHSAACNMACICWTRRKGCDCYLWDEDCPDYIEPDPYQANPINSQAGLASF